MKIDLPELERKLSYGINLTIKESTILLESMQSFIDDKMELQERCDRYEKALTEITNIPESDNYFDCEECIVMMEESAKQALTAIGGDDE